MAVTAPGQVNLASTGLRLAKPQAKTCSTCDQPAHEGPCAGGVGDTAGGASSPVSAGPVGDAAETRPQPAGGEEPDSSPKPVPVKERQVAFSFTKNLLANADSADGFAALFRAFYMTLDERQISYLQGTLQLVMQADAAEEIQQHLEELGINGTFKEI